MDEGGDPSQQDTALLQKPIHLSVQNIRQILNCLDSGTTEMKDLLLNECGLLYECKSCRSIFRNILHFVDHKQSHCPGSQPGHPLETVVPHHFTEILQEPLADTAKEEPLPEEPEVLEDVEARRNKRKAIPKKLCFSEENWCEPLDSSIANPASPPSECLVKDSPNVPPDTREVVVPDSLEDSPAESLLEGEASKVASSCEEMEEEDEESSIGTSSLEETTDSEKTYKENISPEDNQALCLKDNSHDQLEEKKGSDFYDSIFIQDLVDKAREIKTNNENSSGSSNTLERKRKWQYIFENFHKKRKDIEAFMESDPAVKLEDKADDSGEESFQLASQPSLFKMYHKPTSHHRKNLGSQPARPAKSAEGKVLEGYLKQLALRKDSGKGVAFHLTPIPGNTNAMFQVSAAPGDRELKHPQHMKESSDQKPLIVVISKQCEDRGPSSGPKLPPKDPDREGPPRAHNLYVCPKCNSHFSSSKTLHIHNIKIHAVKRVCFPCPFCTATFVQLWSACRHMESVHKKSKEQCIKLRDLVKKRGFLRKNDHTAAEDRVPLKTPLSPAGHVQKCHKCGKVFEKRQQLATHDRFCQKYASSPGSKNKPCLEAKKVVDHSDSHHPSPSIVVNIKKSIKDKKATFSIAHPATETAAAENRTPTTSPIAARPKRFANKKIHKDFVNSQTYRLKSSPKPKQEATSSPPQTLPPTKKSVKLIENKVLSLINLNNLECVKCQKSFSTFSNLRRHTAIHIGWNRYSCKLCRSEFYNKSECREHIQRTHGVDETNAMLEELPLKAAFSGRNNLSNLRPKADAANKSPSLKKKADKKTSSPSSQASKSSKPTKRNHQSLSPKSASKKLSRPIVDSEDDDSE